MSETLTATTTKSCLLGNKMATELNTFPIQKLAELLQEKDDDSDLEDNKVEKINSVSSC